MNRKTILIMLAILVVGHGVLQWQANKNKQNIELGGDARLNSILMPVTLLEQFSDSAIIGKHIFEAKCASCHGQNAAGKKGVAPPLIHKIYEPSACGCASCSPLVIWECAVS